MYEDDNQKFLPGTAVEIIDGTFAGQNGVIVSFDEAKRISGAEGLPMKPTWASCSLC